MGLADATGFGSPETSENHDPAPWSRATILPPRGISAGVLWEGEVTQDRERATGGVTPPGHSRGCCRHSSVKSNGSGGRYVNRKWV
jgi:hypothetical protein